MAENDRHFDPRVRITGNSDKCRQKTVAELPTQVVNDKGRYHSRPPWIMAAGRKASWCWDLRTYMLGSPSLTLRGGALLRFGEPLTLKWSP
jgi:hypothetical protein